MSWTVTIVGNGPHHSAESPRDADRMAARFVQELQTAGHQIDFAKFTSGSDDLTDPLLRPLSSSRLAAPPGTEPQAG